MKKSLLMVVGLLMLTTFALAQPEKTDGFVCPVITNENVLHSVHGTAIANGHYTVLGPNVQVPIHATNDNGNGQPGGQHAAPGDSEYTAIWG